MEIPRDYPILELARFHGHLGPFIVLGYRMGRYALSALNADPFSLRATVFCSGTTPESCLADGVQLGSGCTLGKRNIDIEISSDVACEFRTDAEGVRLVPSPLKVIPSDTPDYELEIEKYAQSLYSLPDDQLFTIERL